VCYVQVAGLAADWLLAQHLLNTQCDNIVVLIFRYALLQEGTIDDTMNSDQVVRMLYTMLGSARVSAHRDMSIATWMNMTIGRGDDARLVHLPDLLTPELIRVLGMLLHWLHLIHVSMLMDVGVWVEGGCE
jgi:hypothetical protein